MSRIAQRRFYIDLVFALAFALASSAPGRLVTAATAAAVPATAAALEVPFELSGNHVFVPVRLQGRDAWFILDTGAGNSLLDMSRAMALGVKLGASFAARGAGPGSTPGAFLAGPASVTVGAGASAVIVPLSASLDFASLSAHAGRDVDGILGGDFIKRFVVEIDYAHRTLRLHEPGFKYAGAGVTLPLTFNNMFPHIRATLKVSDTESFAADCVLDVGSGLAVVVAHPVVVARRLEERMRVSGIVPVGRGAGGLSDGRVGRLSALEIGSLTVPNPIAVLAGENAGVMSSSTLFEVNIGTTVMRRFTMFFDYGRSQVVFEPNGAAADPFEYDMSGLVLTTDGAPYTKKLIEAVTPELSAAAAGLKAGDELKSIDDRPASDLPMDAIRQLFLKADRTYQVVVDRDGHAITVSLTTKRLA